MQKTKIGVRTKTRLLINILKFMRYFEVICTCRLLLTCTIISSTPRRSQEYTVFDVLRKVKYEKQI